MGIIYICKIQVDDGDRSTLPADVRFQLPVPKREKRKSHKGVRCDEICELQ